MVRRYETLLLVMALSLVADERLRHRLPHRSRPVSACADRGRAAAATAKRNAARAVRAASRGGKGRG